MAWDLKNDRPIYLQLIEEIQRRIAAGIYYPGEKLDSVRDMAQQASVNPNTMQKALSELERDGLVYSQRTNGRYITEETEIIEKLKSYLASKQTDEFFEKMYQLGFNASQIISFVKQKANTNE